MMSVTDDFEKRARRRRERWSGGRVRREDASAEDCRFWQAASSSERFSAIWQMTEEAAIMKGQHGAPSRLQGSPVGVRRRQG